MSKKFVPPRADKWFYSRSRVPSSLKKIKGFEDWFYSGPSRFFGHPNDIKKSRKGK